MDNPHHHLQNLYGCREPEVLARADLLQERIDKSLQEFNFSSKYYHQFSPEGVTFAYLGEGVHFTGHSWPEKKTLALDAVSINSTMNLELVTRVKQLIGFSTEFSPLPGILNLERPTYLGLEVISHFSGVEGNNFRDPNYMALMMRKIADSAGFNVVGEVSYQNENSQGRILVLSESHFSLHYFKDGTLWADIFTCGKEGNPAEGINLLKKEINYSKEGKVLYYNR